MPDESSAANEHALIQEITAPLSTLPDDPVQRVADVDFPIVLRGYDRVAVDTYVKQTSQLVAELQTTRSPEAAVRRALERVGEQISGILQRAHDTAAQITTQSRAEAEDRLELARAEAAEIVSVAERRVRELDADTDRIWAERHRLVDDAQQLARQLQGIAEAAAARFPAAEETSEEGSADVPAGRPDVAPYDGDADVSSAPGTSGEEPVAGVAEEPAADEVDPEDRTAVLPPIEDHPPEQDHLPEQDDAPERDEPDA